MYKIGMIAVEATLRRDFVKRLSGWTARASHEALYLEETANRTVALRVTVTEEPWTYFE